ncbi:hypothetical protein [Kitasatospora cinereorecta]
MHMSWSYRLFGLAARRLPSADIRPGPARTGAFSRGTDGITSSRLGPGFSLGHDWWFFIAYRFALFNHAPQALGGPVRVTRCELSTP